MVPAKQTTPATRHHATVYTISMQRRLETNKNVASEDGPPGCACTRASEIKTLDTGLGRAASLAGGQSNRNTVRLSSVAERNYRYFDAP